MIYNTKTSWGYNSFKPGLYPNWVHQSTGGRSKPLCDLYFHRATPIDYTSQDVVLIGFLDPITSLYTKQAAELHEYSFRVSLPPAHRPCSQGIDTADTGSLWVITLIYLQALVLFPTLLLDYSPVSQLLNYDSGNVWDSWIVWVTSVSSVDWPFRYLFHFLIQWIRWPIYSKRLSILC